MAEHEKARYIELYEQLKKEITGGAFPYGTKFMSKRMISVNYGVSLVTAEHSLQLLLDEGYLSAQQRSGYFVSFSERDFYSAPEAVSRSDAVRRPEALEHSFPFSTFARSMRKVITEQAEGLLERVPGKGLYEFRRTIAQYLARSRSIFVDPQQIVIGAGSEYLYGLIAQLFGMEKCFGIENPSYIKIEKVYRSLGARVELLTLGNDGILSEALAGAHADVLHLSPYRSFPSGISTSASKRREYLRWANERKAYIIEDDFESEFTLSSKAEETLFALSSDENVIYLNSFSKTISPAIRISYMLLPKELAARFDEKLGFYACTVPGFEQYVLSDFIASGEFERHLNRVRRKLRNVNG